MSDMQPVSFSVNGEAQVLVVDSRRTLADTIREDLRLTGTHLGCEHGVCGACTVAVDGQPVRSCLMLAVQADGCAIETVESLEAEGILHPVQQAMWDNHSFQCAFCAPGFVMTIMCLIRDGQRPDRDELKAALSGNLCRCTGYHSILDAAEALVAGRYNDA